VEPVPFTGPFSIAGGDFPAQLGSPANLYACQTLESRTTATGNTAEPARCGRHAGRPVSVHSQASADPDIRGRRRPPGGSVDPGRGHVDRAARRRRDLHHRVVRTFWDGIKTFPAGIGCDYEFSGEARLDSGSGFGFVVRATFDGDTPHGHGFQYANDSLGPNDIEYPGGTESGFIGAATTRCGTRWRSASRAPTTPSTSTTRSSSREPLPRSAAACSSRIWRATGGPARPCGRPSQLNRCNPSRPTRPSLRDGTGDARAPWQKGRGPRRPPRPAMPLQRR